MTGAILLPAAALIGAFAIWFVVILRRRNVMRWLPAYVRKDWPGAREQPSGDESPTHILFAIADHFEPDWNNAPPSLQLERVEQWIEDYPRLFSPFKDADGRPPRHTFFYPVEDCPPEHLEKLARLVRLGFAELEIHLHHRNDTSDNLRRTLNRAVTLLRRHGHLGQHIQDHTPRFGFVHGNWALDNSLPSGDWCGVNDELRVLKECGCYADFTLPSAPSATQTRRINSIYYATDDPDRPKSHDDGRPVRAGGRPVGDLMIIQGPLTLRRPGRRLLGLLPQLETARLAGAAPPTPRRVDAWVNTRVCVAGQPRWIFIKAYTHGCPEANRAVLLGNPMLRLHQYLATQYNDGARYKLHYVTAREMYNIIKAAERGLAGDPSQYRDLIITAPPSARAAEKPVTAGDSKP